MPESIHPSIHPSIHSTIRQFAIGPIYFVYTPPPHHGRCNQLHCNYTIQAKTRSSQLSCRVTNNHQPTSTKWRHSALLTPIQQHTPPTLPHWAFLCMDHNRYLFFRSYLTPTTDTAQQTPVRKSQKLEISFSFLSSLTPLTHFAKICMI